MDTKQTLVQELIWLLEKGNAHVPLEEALAGIPPELRGKAPAALPYSLWQLAEHIRIAQWDIVAFCLSGEHQSPAWPEGYWPEAAERVNDQQWEKTLAQIREDRNRFTALLQQEGIDLMKPLPWGSGQSLLREALLIADHTAYHTGEILVARRLLGCWK